MRLNELIRVYVESPFAGGSEDEIRKNIDYARKCMKDCLNRGEAPFASHLLYTQDGVLKDEISEERELGMSAGFKFLEACKKSVVYVDYGISKGMWQGVKLARKLRIPIEYRSIY